MTTTYPSSLDTYTTAVDGTTVVDASDRNNVQAAILALEKFGYPVYNVVTQFGADPTGSIDSSTAINNALTTAGTGAYPLVGGIVLLPRGTYLVNSRLIVPFRVQLMGVGRDATTIKASNTFPTSTEVVRLGDLTGGIGEGCRLENLTVDSNNLAGSVGVYSERINEESGIFRCLIQNFVAFGIQINQPASGATAQNWSIDDCEFAGGTGALASTVSIGVTNTSLATEFRRISRVSVGGLGSAATFTNAITIDGVVGGHLEDIHAEVCTNGINLGSNHGTNGIVVESVTCQATVTNAVTIGANAGDNIVIMGVVPNGATNAVNDVINSITIPTFQLGLYTYGGGGVGSSVILCTASGVPNRFRRVQILKDLRRSFQTPSEGTLVSGVDATAGEYIEVTLSAARLVGLPLNPATGQVLTFTLIQNGTGGFAVTWNAVFKVSWSDTGNTANKRSTISFIYDGTNWNQTGAQTPYV